MHPPSSDDGVETGDDSRAKLAMVEDFMMLVLGRGRCWGEGSPGVAGEVWEGGGGEE